MSDSEERASADGAAIERALGEARAVRARAHAPFSRFSVGAAVLDGGGTLHAGCNVESASYGLTICAERNALSSRVAAVGGPGGAAPPVVVVAISTHADVPTPPCGACRQWLAEFAPDAVVVAEAADGATERWTVAELLPGPFLGGEIER